MGKKLTNLLLFSIVRKIVVQKSTVLLALLTLGASSKGLFRLWQLVAQHSVVRGVALVVCKEVFPVLT